MGGAMSGQDGILGREGKEQTSMVAEKTGLSGDISEDPILQIGSGFRAAKLLFVSVLK